MGEWKNKLHYGDNLEVLRNMETQSVDLIYLDPPFNSARNYNLLFKQHKGQDSQAQIMAFEDTWQWSHLEYQKFCSDERNAPLHKLIASLYEILGDSEMEIKADNPGQRPSDRCILWGIWKTYGRNRG